MIFLVFFTSLLAFSDSSFAATDGGNTQYHFQTNLKDWEITESSRNGCGLNGSIEERMQDCASKRPDKGFVTLTQYRISALLDSQTRFVLETTEQKNQYWRILSELRSFLLLYSPIHGEIWTHVSFSHWNYADAENYCKRLGEQLNIPVQFRLPVDFEVTFALQSGFLPFMSQTGHGSFHSFWISSEKSQDPNRASALVSGLHKKWLKKSVEFLEVAEIHKDVELSVVCIGRLK